MTGAAFPKPEPRRAPLAPGQHRRSRLRWRHERKPPEQREVGLARVRAGFVPGFKFPEYLRFVALQPCRVREVVEGATKCRGDVVACHIVFGRGQKGTGLKADDRQAIPMCCGHHDEFDGRNRGKGTTFARWSQGRRDRWAARQIAETLDRALPRDRDEALAFQGMGIGVWIEADSIWIPGPADAGADLVQLAKASGGGGSTGDAGERPTIPREAQDTGGAEVDYAATASSVSTSGAS